MLLDTLTLLSSAQAVTTTAYSTNTIDLGDVTPKRSIGDGEPLVVAINVLVAADFTTMNETYSFGFVQSANANLTSDDNLVDVTIAAATLVAGYSFAIEVPVQRITKRYIGMEYTTGGTTPTITVDAHLIPRRFFHGQTIYADNVTIS